MTQEATGEKAASADGSRSLGASDGPDTASGTPGPRRRRLTHAVPLAVVLVGLAVTGAVTATARFNYLHNEQRLVTLQAHLTASTLQVTPTDIERRLGRAVGEAAVAAGSAPLFQSSIATSLSPHGPLAVAELFQMTATGPRLVTKAGGAPVLAASSGAMASVATTAADHVGELAVVHLVRPGVQRFGYAMASQVPGATGRYVAYGEQVLPANDRITVPGRSPDANLHVAIYFGRRTTHQHLVESDASRLPLTGATATATIPFGDKVLTLVASPRGSLAGPFAVAAAWLIMALGLLFTAVATWLAVRQVRRREAAEAAASESERRYRFERQVSETLQRALLPPHLPDVPGVQLAARYRSGARGVEVGGDWYDVVDVGGHHVFFCVGDVSGRGLETAVLMAELRHAANTHAADGGGPALVLDKLSRLVDVERRDHFATVLCGRLELDTGQLTLASAGHLPPVLIDGDDTTLVAVPPGPPIGVGGSYRGIDLRLDPGATLLAVTDGLVERRGEGLDAGLERLRQAVAHPLPLDRLLDEVLATMVPDGPPDDIAMLGLRWQPHDRAGAGPHGRALGAEMPRAIGAPLPGSPRAHQGDEGISAPARPGRAPGPG